LDLAFVLREERIESMIFRSDSGKSEVAEAYHLNDNAGLKHLLYASVPGVLKVEQPPLSFSGREKLFH
jgi:hypothetical protein